MKFYDSANKEKLSYLSTPERLSLIGSSDEELEKLFNNLTKEEILFLYECEMGGEHSKSLWPESEYVYGYRKDDKSSQDSLLKKGLIIFLEKNKPGGFIPETGWYNTQKGHETIWFIIKTQYNPYLKEHFLKNEELKDVITHVSHAIQHGQNTNLHVSIKREIRHSYHYDFTINKFSNEIVTIGSLGDIGWHTSNIEKLIEKLSKIKIEKDNFQNILKKSEPVKSFSEFIEETFKNFN